MAAIERISIGENRWGAGEAADVRLYAVNGATDLTLAQLCAAVSLRLAGVLEHRGVQKMNDMTAQNAMMSAMAGVVEQVVTPGVKLDDAAKLPADYAPRSATFAAAPTVKNFMLFECAIPANDVPADLDSYERRMNAYKALKTKLDSATSTSQEIAIALRTCLSRRDVAYSTASGIVNKYQATSMDFAVNF